MEYNMDKATALQTLNKLVQRINDLAQYDSREGNLLFDKWYSDVSIDLGYIFTNDDGEHIHKFKTINFNPKKANIGG
jgi:hypothetical protein